MLYGETEVRDNIRNRDGRRVFFLRKGDQLTASARDFLNRERIEILPAEQAKQECFCLLSGGTVVEKPEHMTHLKGNVLVPKTHPRIRFRGAVDTLEAELVLCQLILDERWKKPVGEVLDFTRRLIRWDVMEEPVEQKTLCGLTEGELRQRSHFPQEFYNQPHFMPEASDGIAVVWLNRARCAARQAELAAVEAFSDREGNPTRVDMIRAMNRLSSMLYILMIQAKSRSKEP